MSLSSFLVFTLLLIVPKRYFSSFQASVFFENGTFYHASFNVQSEHIDDAAKAAGTPRLRYLVKLPLEL